jgi:hypothetical protein
MSFLLIFKSFWFMFLMIFDMFNPFDFLGDSTLFDILSFSILIISSFYLKFLRFWFDFVFLIILVCPFSSWQNWETNLSSFILYNSLIDLTALLNFSSMICRFLMLNISLSIIYESNDDSLIHLFIIKIWFVVSLCHYLNWNSKYNILFVAIYIKYLTNNICYNTVNSVQLIKHS